MLIITLVPPSILLFLYVRLSHWESVGPTKVETYLVRSIGHQTRYGELPPSVCDRSRDCCGTFTYCVIQTVRWIFVDFVIRFNMVSDWGAIILYRSYLVLDAFVLVLALFLCWGVYGSVFGSFFYTIPFISANQWTFQFWLFVASLMTLPLIITSILLFYCCTPGAVRDKDPGHCNVYLLHSMYNAKFNASHTSLQRTHIETHVNSY